METTETTAFEQTILKLGLVNEGQLAEIHDEIGRVPELQHLISALERKSYMTPWQRGKILKGDLEGINLGGYRLLYKIQSGSFGRVYRAVDPRDGRVVAVKVLRRRWSDNEQRIEMFIREGKVGLVLKHPNIVEVLAINRDAVSGQYYIVMEFVEGGNIREILTIRNKLSVAESLKVVEDCASGLAYSYKQGMTHRDIKLTNILLSDTREAKLVDFGLAHFFSTLARSEDEKVDRTVDYAGLEKATNVKIGDERSDIYFLGCVLYECLTGRSPLVMPRDKYARMRRGRFEEVLPIHPNEIEGPPSVLMLVETMMALEPKDRFQTPSQLLDAIRKVRREVEGKSAGEDGQAVQRSVFLVEPDVGLQDKLRDKMKEQGYRVFLAGDPQRALDRFHKQPYDGLVVDARTTGEEGVHVFELIVEEAARRRIRCAALLLLNEEEADQAGRLPRGPHIGVLSDHITFNTMSRRLKELMEAAHGSEAVPAVVRSTTPPAPSPRQDDLPSPPRREPTTPRAPADFSPPPLRKESMKPPRREPPPSRPTRPSASNSPPVEEDFPLLAFEEATALQASDENIPAAPAEEETALHASDEEIPVSGEVEDSSLSDQDEDSPLDYPAEDLPKAQDSEDSLLTMSVEDDLGPPYLEEQITPPPLHEEVVPAPRAQKPAAAPTPPPRRSEKKKRAHRRQSEEGDQSPPTAPHKWLEELGIDKEQKEKATFWSRIRNFWRR